MGWDGARTISLLTGGLALVATAASAQQSSAHRRGAEFVEASFSTSDVLGQSLAHAAVASADLKRQDARLSQADLFGLMILVSLPNKHQP
jgi:uncharacterized protein YjbI with pentapeptide repeats